jgi:hypothetical protein
VVADQHISLRRVVLVDDGLREEAKPFDSILSALSLVRRQRKNVRAPASRALADVIRLQLGRERHAPSDFRYGDLVCYLAVARVSGRPVHALDLIGEERERPIPSRPVNVIFSGR